MTGAIIGGAATGNASGGTAVIAGNSIFGPMTEAERDNRAFNGGPYGADVSRDNVFAGFTFDVNDRMRVYFEFARRPHAVERSRRARHPAHDEPWTTQIFVDNAYLPANVRNAMIAQGVDSFVMEKQGQWLGQPGNYDDHEKRDNQYDSWTLQLGLDKDIGSNWKMQAHVQRGATRRFTQVENEVRVDREMLAVDAVEVYKDHRDVNGDGIVDLVANADRGTGQIICNVQRYNPTRAQLQASVATVRVPAAQGDDSLGNGSPLDLVPIPSPVGPDAIPNCVPINIFGQGNVSSAAAAYVVSPKWGDSVVTQEFAEALFTGDIWKGYGPGAFSMAVGATWRSQWFWQRGQPQQLMAYGPPKNAPSLGIRGIQGGFTTGSPNLHEFSTVPTIKGSYDVWEAFSEINMPLWAAQDGKRRLEMDVAARYSDYSTSGGINSWKTGINFQATNFLRFRTTVSRDVREPTFAERFDVQGGGGSVMEKAINNIPNPNGVLDDVPDHERERRQSGPRAGEGRYRHRGHRRPAGRHGSAVLDRLVRHRSRWRDRSARRPKDPERMHQHGRRESSVHERRPRPSHERRHDRLQPVSQHQQRDDPRLSTTSCCGTNRRVSSRTSPSR